MCRNLCNVCLHNLTNEENEILQDEAKENAKQWNERFYIEKSIKEEEEVMKVNR